MGLADCREISIQAAIMARPMFRSQEWELYDGPPTTWRLAQVVDKLIDTLEGNASARTVQGSRFLILREEEGDYRVCLDLLASFEMDEDERPQPPVIDPQFGEQLTFDATVGF